MHAWVWNIKHYYANKKIRVGLCKSDHGTYLILCYIVWRCQSVWLSHWTYIVRQYSHVRNMPPCHSLTLYFSNQQRHSWVWQRMPPDIPDVFSVVLASNRRVHPGYRSWSIRVDRCWHSTTMLLSHCRLYQINIQSDTVLTQAQNIYPAAV